MILSIESSCDDSSIAITEISSAKLLFHKKISQESIHSTYGGVVPEIASRLHAQELPRILHEAKKFLNDSFNPLKAIAVTTEPGLNITLIEGLMMAKTLCFSLKLPLIAINHLKGHIYSLFINQSKSVFPLSVLLVSGGHTLIIEAKSDAQMSIIAKSKDDSFGESFDKVAKMLSLGYPGGPIIEKTAAQITAKLAQNPQIQPFTFPLPLKNSKELAFSFSGLKNAVRLKILQSQEQGLDISSEDFREKICYGFQKTACAHLLMQIKKYFQAKKESNEAIQNFAIVGGASANQYLRNEISEICKSYGAQLLLAPLEFCSDNAAMIGRAALQKYSRGEFAEIFTLQSSPKSSIGEFVEI